MKIFTFYDLLFCFSFCFCFHRIYSWRYIYWMCCRWHYVQQQLCQTNRVKRPFDLHRPLLVRRHTWTRWIHCNRVKIVVANSKLCSKVAPATHRILIVYKHPNIHRSPNHIMPFIRNQQHRPVDILSQLTHKVVFPQLLLGQVRYLPLGFRSLFMLNALYRMLLILLFSTTIGPTPVIMQYLPHNPNQGQIQYLQLIPTRPLIVPISPYIPSNFNNPYASNPNAQASASSPYTLSHHPSSPYTLPSSQPQQTSSSYGSSAYGSGSYGSSSYAPSLQNPIGGYSTNYMTYSIRPNHGMQLVNGPLDLSLNTNEYIPIQNENTYKMRRV